MSNSDLEMDYGFTRELVVNNKSRVYEFKDIQKSYIDNLIKKIQEILPYYDDISFIGKGGMGVVFKARNRKLNRIEAIKLLLKSNSSRKAKERFKKEMKSLGRLNHPNIVKLFSASLEDEENLFLVWNTLMVPLYLK